MRTKRLQWQLLFSVLAAASVAALSAVLIFEAVRSAERSVVADAHRTLQAALEELARQYRERSEAEPTFAALPAEAQDVSLRAMGQIVFRSYPEVGGGYYAEGQLLGSTIPDSGPGALERSTQREIAARGLAVGPGVRALPGTHDLLAYAARQVEPGVVVWALKRLVGRNDPWIGRRALLLALLGFAALVSVGGAIATGIALRRGVGEMQRGLVRLEHDFSYALPQRNDELGEISGSINRMAAARRMLEAELAREERLRLIGRLVAGVAHEIRNPLNSIRLAMELIEQRLRRGTLQPEQLQMVRSEVDRLNGLLTDLLTFNQAKKPDTQRLPVIPLLRRCVELLRVQAGERGVRLKIDAAEANCEAAFDPQRLMQAVMNLVLNAIQATPPGGTVTVLVETVEGAVRIAVRDCGPGLSREQREHLFEAFYTTKPNGTGLGLAVSRELLSSMGGELSFEETEPGACFVLSLPERSKTYA